MKKNLLAISICMSLVACGGSGGSGGSNDSGSGDSNNPGSGGGNNPGSGGDTSGYTLSGSISGLTGSLDLTNTSNQETISVAGNSFSFSKKVGDNGQYSIDIASAAEGQQLCEIQNASGSISAANVTDIALTCRDWSENSKMLNDDDAIAQYPKATRVGDSVHVTWYNHNVLGGYLFKQAYNAVDGWMATPFLAAVEFYTPNTHELVGNAAGQNMLTFKASRRHYTYDFIYARSTLSFSGTSYSNQADYYEYAIDIDEQGHVLLVWAAPDDTNSAEKSLYYRYFDGSWGAKVKLENNHSADVKNPVVEFTGNGKAIAAWEFGTEIQGQGVTSFDGIQAAAFDASKSGSKWTVDSTVDLLNGGCALVKEKSLNLTVTESGIPTLAWIQGNGQCGNDYQQPVSIAKYENSAWSNPVNISGTDSKASSLKTIALTADKILFAYGANSKSYSQDCDITTGECQSAVELSQAVREAAAIAKDTNNNVMVAWLDHNSSKREAYVNRYDIQQNSWSEMTKVNQDHAGHITIESVGQDFVVAWSENSVARSEWTVFAKEFTSH